MVIVLASLKLSNLDGFCKKFKSFDFLKNDNIIIDNTKTLTNEMTSTISSV